MKLDSKYFDSIRVKPRSEEPRPTRGRPCQWKGCSSVGTHRAPRGRGRDGQYVVFCLDHVRQFNASYNYFEGMSDTEVEDFQRSAVTGHRPTWKLGENAAAAGRETPGGARGFKPFSPEDTADPHDVLGQGQSETATNPRRRQLKPLERKSLETMHLPEQASKVEIKSRFKELVKRHHPDSNGGDKASEDKLREIIQAYNYLKQAGLV